MLKPNEKRAKEIREELSYIGRYQDSISPKLAKYAELEEKKRKLRIELRKVSV